MAHEIKANSTQEADSLLKQLRAEFNKGAQLDAQNCQTLLTKLKLVMIKLHLMPPFRDIQAVKPQLLVARETLEMGALISVQAKDVASFQRYYAQVKVYYTDYSTFMSESERQWMIVGLNLLSLLAHGMIAEFHTALELIPQQHQEKIFIKYVVQLEQWLMEGSYNKILSASKTLPSPFYNHFMTMLADTVREKISDCCEKSYETLGLQDARMLLMFENDDGAKKYCQKRKWLLSGTVIHFGKTTDEPADIPSESVIRVSLEYATELERII
jgi:26S proteasome regulatory subunit N12